MNSTPQAFSVTENGNYCPGAAGLMVGLNGSEAGVSYQLKKSGVNFGSPVIGTGAAFDFGYQTAGYYTVVATLGSCTATMSGSATITQLQVPAIPTPTVTPNPVCEGSNHGGNDYWVVKVDGSGTIQWQKSLGGSHNFDWGSDIQQTSDLGYIVVGTSYSNDGDVTGSHGDADIWVVKLDASGNISWQKALGGSLSEQGASIQQTSDGGYIVIGSAKSDDGNVSVNIGLGTPFYPAARRYDVWVVRLDGSGNILWEKSLGGQGEDQGYGVHQTLDEGYFVGGYTTSSEIPGYHGNKDYWVGKLDGSGNLLWQKAMGGTSGEELFSVQQTSEQGYVIAGRSSSNNGDVSGGHGGNDYWVVKLRSDCGISKMEASTLQANTVSEPLFEVYPNPTNGMLRIVYNANGDMAQSLATATMQTADGIAVHDLAGKMMKYTVVENVTRIETEMDVHDLTDGVYFISVMDGGAMLKTARVVKLSR